MSYQYDPNMHEVRRRCYMSPTAIDEYIGGVPGFVKLINSLATQLRAESVKHISEQVTLSSKESLLQFMTLNSTYGKLGKGNSNSIQPVLIYDAQEHFKRMEAIKQKQHCQIRRVWLDADNKPLGEQND